MHSYLVEICTYIYKLQQSLLKKLKSFPYYFAISVICTHTLAQSLNLHTQLHFKVAK